MKKLTLKEKLTLTLKQKTITAALIFILTLFMASANAQQLSQSSIFGGKETQDHNIEYFKVMEVNDKLYFKFLITEKKEHIAYVLESSINGEDFSACQIKEGYKSPNDIPLLYCFSEKSDHNSEVAYRIKRVSFDGEIDYSCALVLDQENPNRIWSSCAKSNNQQGIKNGSFSSVENKPIASK